MLKNTELLKHSKITLLLKNTELLKHSKITLR